MSKRFGAACPPLRRPVAALVAVLLCGSGCSSGEPASPSEAEDTAPDVAAPDAAAESEGTTPSPQETATPGTATFEIGVHRAGNYDPEQFVTCPPGDTTPILAEFGQQSAWMFVLGARTDQLPVGTERVRAVASLIDADGTVWGELDFHDRPAFQAPDGLYYVMNLFLVVPSDKGWLGREAVLKLSIEDADGFIRLERKAGVVLDEP